MLQLVNQSYTLYQLYLSSGNGNAQNVGDPTPLFETWSRIAQNACVPPEDLFSSLADACNNTQYSQSVAADSLNHLLMSLVSQPEASVGDRNSNTDQAILTNQCFQSNVGPAFCAEEDFVTYKFDAFASDAFYFSCD
jgi:hypothetical protein